MPLSSTVIARLDRAIQYPESSRWGREAAAYPPHLHARGMTTSGAMARVTVRSGPSISVDGQITQKPVNPHLKKYSDLQKDAGRPIFLTIPSHQRGESRSSRSRGGLRWTRRVLKTTAPEAYGKNVWARHSNAGVKFAAQALRTTVAKKPGRRGEHDISRKPLRGECRVIPV